MQNLTIPDDVDFAALALEHEPVTHRLLFATGPLADVCRVNGLEPAVVLADEDLACSLICAWYVSHRDAGGAPDPVAETILAEVADSLQPGDGVEHYACGTQPD